MLRQGTSPINSPLGWFPVQDTHEIAVTADKSREHPSSTVCHIVLPAHHIPAIPRTSATRHLTSVTEITSAPSSPTSATTKGLPRQFPGGADLRGGGPSGRLVETCPTADSDGASAPVDPCETAHVTGLTQGSAPRSSTASPTTPPSSKPAPTPTASPTLGPDKPGDTLRIGSRLPPDPTGGSGGMDC